MNSYLLESIDSLSLQKEREKIIKENSFSEVPISFYDLEETSLSNALEDLDTYGLFSEKKVVVIQNLEVLKADEDKESIEHLFSYIKNPNPDYLLLLEAKKLNRTLKITKELLKLCTVPKIEFSPKEFIKEELKDYSINPSVISLLEEFCKDDMTKIHQECQKLKSYKVENKTITKEDVQELVVQKLGDGQELTFAFSRALALKDKKEALEKFHELLSYDIEPISLIGLLASQIRIIYQVKLLEKEKLTNQQIASKLGEKSDYRIAKTRELTKLYSEEELLSLMQELAKMDYQLKTEDVDGLHLIEMYILNI